MFGFWDGLKIRMLALAAMLLTAGSPHVLAAHTAVKAQVKSPPVVAQVQAPTVTPKTDTAPQTITKPPVTPPVTPVDPESPPVVKPPTCGCTQMHKTHTCSIYCRTQ